MIDDVTPEDEWGDIIVSFNPNSFGKYISLPEGTWVVVADDDEAGIIPVSTGTSIFYANEYDGSFYVAPYSAVVMYRSADAPAIYMSILQNPGLNNYLHFAVNIAEDFEKLALSVNDSDLLLEQLEGNSWFADHQMSTTGDVQALLTVDDYSLIRNFSIGSLGNGGGSGRSYDGKVFIEFPAECSEYDIYFAIFEKDAVYEIGTANVVLDRKAAIKFLTDENNKAIYRRSGDQWIELPTIFHNGYVTAETYRLGEFRLDEAVVSFPVTSVIGNYPNPFNPDTEISFNISSMDHDKNCSLKIYNIKGQLVRTLLEESLPSGNHQVIWNGKDNGSRPVSSGVYFFNLTVDSRSISHKMLLLK